MTKFCIICADFNSRIFRRYTIKRQDMYAAERVAMARFKRDFNVTAPYVSAIIRRG